MHEEKMRRRGDWRQSESAQVSREVVLGLRDVLHASSEMRCILQRGDASRLRQGIDTPGWTGPLQCGEDVRGADGIAQAQASQRVRFGHRAQYQHIVT